MHLKNMSKLPEFTLKVYETHACTEEFSGKIESVDRANGVDTEE